MRLSEAIRQEYGPRGVAEFSRRSGLARRTIEYYLAQRTVPNLKQLERIVSSLTIDPTWLVFGVSRMELVVEGTAPYSARVNIEVAETRLREGLTALESARRSLSTKKE